ncbi:hypothetical protein [Acidipropionibacterium virtanenii]|uniref:hypothetical protein n=1 Tax=Acidipropionibacterium virtanenii TaxID=2057246 RepID=UPI0011BDB1A9|nr:hypothetical protein [Acidipropionibacterium virtanenii]
MTSSPGNEPRCDAAARTRHAAGIAVRAADAVVRVTSAPSDTSWWTRLDTLVRHHIDQSPSIAQLALWINDAVRCLSVSIADSSRATAVLIAQGVNVQLSALASARVCLESTSRLNYLLDQQDHLLEHALLMLWQDLNDEAPMNRWAQDRQLGAGRPHLPEELEELTTALRWTVNREKGGRFRSLQNPDTGAKSSLPSATTLIKELPIASAEQAWRITSAASHSRTWLLSHEISHPDEPIPAATSLTAAATTIDAVTATARLIGTTFDVPALLHDADRLATTTWGAPPTWA